MLRRARASGRLALVDHELRFLPARRKMRDMILGGEIGRVRHAKFLFRSDSRASAERPWSWWSDDMSAASRSASPLLIASMNPMTAATGGSGVRTH